MAEAEAKKPEAPATVFGLLGGVVFYAAILVFLGYTVFGAPWEKCPAIIWQKMAAAGLRDEAQNLMCWGAVYVWLFPWAARKGNEAWREMWLRLRRQSAGRVDLPEA